MKQLSSLLLRAMCLLTFVVMTACSKDKYEEPEASFKVVSNTIESQSVASVGLISVSEGDFKYAVSADWCNVKQKDNTTLEVSLLENASAEMRSCIITLTKGSTQIFVPVHQMGRIYAVESLASFTLDSKGGEKRFAVEGDKAPEVKHNADWLQVRYEAGELIFTLVPMTNIVSRSTNVEVRTALFTRTIKVSQNLSRDFLLGAYTLDYIVEHGQPKRTAEVTLAKREDGNFELRGLALPIPVTIDMANFSISIQAGEMPKPQDITAEDEKLYLYLWGGGYPKEDGQPNYSLDLGTFVGTWNNSVERPVFTFADPRPNSGYKAIAFNVFKGNQWSRFYAGVNGISALTDFSITKK